MNDIEQTLTKQAAQQVVEAANNVIRRMGYTLTQTNIEPVPNEPPPVARAKRKYTRKPKPDSPVLVQQCTQPSGAVSVLDELMEGK